MLGSVASGTPCSMEGLRPQGYAVISTLFKVTMMGHPVEYVVLQFRDTMRRLVSHALASR